jgi:hypothetical protein
MTAISQRIPNFIGGVSQQADEKMLLGQVKDAVNCYPDITLGMLKRPGGKFIGRLASLTANTADQTAWFSMFRDNQEKYIANVTSAGVVKVWNLLTGLAGTVTYPADKQASIESYLTATDYRSIKTLTINDFTYIINSEKTVTAKAAPTYNTKRQATIIITGIEHSTLYRVTINGTNYDYTSPAAGGGNLRITDITSGIFTAITGNFDTKTVIDNTLYLTFTTDTNVSGYAGVTGKDLRVFQDSIDTFSRLPEQAFAGQIVKINNTSADKDDFYLKYVQPNGIASTYSQTGTTVTVTTPTPHGLSTNNLVNVVVTSGTGVSGNYKVTVTSTTAFTYTAASQTASGNVDIFTAASAGYWEETVSPSVSTGLNEATMPVALIRTSVSPLTFRATFLDSTTYSDGSAVTSPVDPTKFVLQWEPRLVGDNESNSHPSFVDNTIQDIFLFNNRLGFLTEDNVSMSQAGDYYNFYHKSATTVTAADPIDLSCASIKPATVRSVVPITQGLLLFSDNQQFLMEAENGAWTPANCSISTIANYECDRYIKPIDLGSTVLYVSRNQSWSRAFEIFTRGQRETPSVTETTKIVPEWMPNGITDTTGSAQNGLWVASGRTSKYLYIHRYYEQGEERPMAAWVKWLLPSNVIHTAIQNDILYVLTSGTEGYTLTQHKLVLAPSTGGLINIFGNAVDPYLDSWCEVTDVAMVSPVPPTAPTYNQVNDTTKVYLPTYFDTTKTIRYVVGLKKVPPAGTESGYTNVATLLTDGGGTYFSIPGDASGSYIYVGYEYSMELILPRYYYNMGQPGVDFTAVTTTSRMAFYTGLGGDIYFNLKDRTRSEWYNVNGAKIADLYTADTSPFRDVFIYKVPIYQRPDNYTMKVTSNTPFPVSLVSMQWEGQYAPGFYRRT